MVPALVRRFDEVVDRRVEVLRTPTADKVMYRLTESANHSMLWHLLNIGLAPAAPGRALRTAVALGVESALVNGLVKRLFDRSRPLHEGPRPHRLRSPKTTSFPSGHATSAFCAAVLLGERRSRPVRAGLYLLAGLVSFSRVHVRLHHGSDVVAGAVGGWLFGRSVRRRFER